MPTTPTTKVWQMGDLTKSVFGDQGSWGAKIGMNFEHAERLSKSVCSDTECCGMDGIVDSELFTDIFSYKQSSSCAKESAYEVCVESGKELCQVFNGTLRKDGVVRMITNTEGVVFAFVVMLGSIIYALDMEYNCRCL